MIEILCHVLGDGEGADVDEGRQRIDACCFVIGGDGNVLADKTVCQHGGVPVFGVGLDGDSGIHFAVFDQLQRGVILGVANDHDLAGQTQLADCGGCCHSARGNQRGDTNDGGVGLQSRLKGVCITGGIGLGTNLLDDLNVRILCDLIHETLCTLILAVLTLIPLEQDVALAAECFCQRSCMDATVIIRVAADEDLTLTVHGIHIDREHRDARFHCLVDSRGDGVFKCGNEDCRGIQRDLLFEGAGERAHVIFAGSQHRRLCAVELAAKLQTNAVVDEVRQREQRADIRRIYLAHVDFLCAGRAFCCGTCGVLVICRARRRAGRRCATYHQECHKQNQCYDASDNGSLFHV